MQFYFVGPVYLQSKNIDGHKFGLIDNRAEITYEGHKFYMKIPGIKFCSILFFVVVVFFFFFF